MMRRNRWNRGIRLRPVITNPARGLVGDGFESGNARYALLWADLSAQLGMGRSEPRQLNGSPRANRTSRASQRILRSGAICVAERRSLMVSGDANR